MPFHRLVTPTYFGGLPGGYDYLNTPSDPSVGGSGVPAPASNIKTGGYNDGSYFVAFSEDAQATAANRPAKALAQNTDFLDDVLRTSIPTVTFLDGTAVGAVATVALTGQIYVGESGAANNQPQRDRIVRVTDQNNNDLEVSGTKIVATLIHDGAAANVIGTQASGFRTNVSVNFSPSIPNGTTYRVWHGVRNSFLNISQVDKGGLFEEQLRTINNVAGEVRSLFRQIHAESSVGQVWDQAFDSTIRSVAASGLNERYRRATTQPVGFVTGNFNSAGAGAVINRDGRAVEIQADTDMLIQNTTWKDGNHALLKLGVENARSSGGNPITSNTGGDFGIWHESEWKAQNGASDAGMFTRITSAGPALVDVVPYDMRAATFDGDTLLTSINAASATATLNPDSINSTASRSTVQCGPGQYFSLSAPTRTAIRLGIDLLEITDSGGRVRTFIIDALLSSTRVRVIGPAGTTAGPFAAAAEAGCTIRILQRVVNIGGHLGDNTTIFWQRPLWVIPPAILTTVVGNEDVPPCAFFGSQTGSVIDATADAVRARALEWGSTASPDAGGTVNGLVTPLGWLNGDGSINATRIRATGLDISNGSAFIDEFGNAELDDLVAETVQGADAHFTHVSVERPEFYSGFSEDWLQFQQTFTPDYIIGDSGPWNFIEDTDFFTVNNGAPAANSKNPGRLEIVGTGGSTSRILAIYKSGLLQWSYDDIEMVTMVMKVNDGAANLASQMSVGLRDNATFLNGGNDSLMVYYLATDASWRLIHRKGGASGTHHNAALAANTNNVFVVVRFLKNADGDMEIYGNLSLITTILEADLPDGNCFFGAVFSQTVADPDPTFFVNDFWGLRAQANVRSGA